MLNKALDKTGISKSIEAQMKKEIIMNTKENKKHKNPWMINAGVLIYK